VPQRVTSRKSDLIRVFVVAGAALAAFAVAAQRLPLVAVQGSGPKAKTAAGASVERRSPHRAAGESMRPWRTAPTRVAATPAARPAAKRERVARPHTTYVSNVVTKTSTRTTPTHSAASAAATPRDAGPAALPAPAPGASQAKPLKAP
jgi:hypothetical protein